MAEADIQSIIDTPDGDTTWGDDMRGAMSTLKLIDAAAGTASRRTLGAGASQAAPGNADAAQFGSGAATDGLVLTADGAGGAAWEAAAGGGSAATVVSSGDPADLQTALDAGGTIDVVGTYDLTATLTLTVERTWVRFLNGAKLSWATVGTRVPLLQVQTSNARIDNIECEGSGDRGDGIGVQVGGHAATQPHGVQIVNPRMTNLNVGVEFSIEDVENALADLAVSGNASSGDNVVYGGRIRLCQDGILSIGFVNYVYSPFVSECAIGIRQHSKRNSGRIVVVNATANQCSDVPFAIDGGRGSGIINGWAEHTNQRYLPDGTTPASPTEMVRIGSATETARNVYIGGVIHLHPTDVTADGGTIEDYVIRVVNGSGTVIDHFEATDELPAVALVGVDASNVGSLLIRKVSFGDAVPAGYTHALLLDDNGTGEVVIREAPSPVEGAVGGATIGGEDAPPLRDADYTLYSVDGTGTGTYFAVTPTGHVDAATTGTDALKSLLDPLKASGAHWAFAIGTFDFGTWTAAAQKFNFVDLDDMILSGSGIDKTILRNSSDLTDSDYEVINCTRCNRMTVRDMTVHGAGAARSTTDALDFDDGDGMVIERVKITGARGSGLAFDGKDAGATSRGHTVRDVIIENVNYEGILCWAVNDSLFENVRVNGAGVTASGQGLKFNRHSGGNCHNNTVRGGIFEANTHGIAIYAGERNLIDGVLVRDNTSHGVYMATFNDGHAGLDHVLIALRSVNNGGYGVNIAPNVDPITATRIVSHVSSGNTSGALNDGGTNTVQAG